MIGSDARQSPSKLELRIELPRVQSKAEAYYGDLVTYGFWQTHQSWSLLGPHTPAELEHELLQRPLPPALTMQQDSETSLACFTFDEKRLRGDPSLNAPDAHMVDVEGGYGRCRVSSSQCLPRDFRAGGP